MNIDENYFIEHIKHLKSLNCEAVEVKKCEELDDISGIILPGGESTTNLKFHEYFLNMCNQYAN
ncbi:hypothetical protein D9O40_02975 [Clostridium autoethanogenum]|uniref:Uncharacterized protein n=1 Tax=Clostridium autoethanogenum TaxID=84023 RepID=A0A3M0T087_9CLOT|nr:hypothetical protein D9O40_02975 [Clostridium autoethanogenum]